MDLRSEVIGHRSENQLPFEMRQVLARLRSYYYQILQPNSANIRIVEAWLYRDDISLH